MMAVDPRLGQLAALARIRSERSLADFAAHTRACAQIKRQIEEANLTARAALADAKTPEAASLAIAYSGHCRQRQLNLALELARAELKRKAALAVAAKDEGRKIALDRLRDQAS